jgi:hypothetical protein
MSNENFSCKCKIKSDPSSRNYAKEVKNKANEKSPYGEDEPSAQTDFKRTHNKF